MGKKRKKKAREKLAGREKGRGFQFFFQFPPVLFSCLRFLQFSEPDSLEAWNRLVRIRRVDLEKM